MRTLRSTPQRLKRIDHSPQSKWEWYPCNFIFSQFLENKQIYWSTTPKYKLYAENCQINPEIKLTMKKYFSYDNGFWHWHKSWILPEIDVTIELSENIVLPIYAVKAQNENQDEVYLQNVGLKGIIKIKAQIGSNIFTTLKFDSTSFKHKGTKFNLMIIVSIGELTSKTPRIIWSSISPPVFVDSRKTIDKDQLRVNSIYSEFSPNCLAHQLVMKKSRESQVIGQDLQSLINYFKAPNIRNKIKNPLFLAYRFPSCIQLFYNSHRINKEQKLISTCLQLFRMQLIKINEKTNYDKQRFEIDRINFNALISLHILADSTEEKLKIKQILSKFLNCDNQLVNFVFEASILSSKFVPISDISIIKWYYQLEYDKHKSNIYMKKNKYSSDSESDFEQVSPQEKPINKKNIKVIARQMNSKLGQDCLQNNNIVVENNNNKTVENNNKTVEPTIVISQKKYQQKIPYDLQKTGTILPKVSQIPVTPQTAPLNSDFQLLFNVINKQWSFANTFWKP